MKVGVSGSGGFVGSAIVEDLASEHAVVAVKHRLEDVPNERLFSGLNAFIHCAHDFSARTERKNFDVNVSGSTRLLTTAVRAGVKKLIFISSVAAFDGCRSFYGRGKLAVENEITRLGGVSLRAGLVEGPGDRGLIGALRNVASLPAIPIFDGGKQPLAVVDLRDLSTAIKYVLETNSLPPPHVIIVAKPATVTFAELIRQLAADQGKAPILFSFPSKIAYYGLFAIESIGLRPPFRSDGLTALLFPNPDVGERIPRFSELVSI